jgi:hypothetical protein
LEHFGLVVWPQVTNKCWNIGPRIAKLAPQICWYPFSALGPIQGHKVPHLLVTWGRLNFFSPISVLTHNKLLRLISTFAPVGMLDAS